jgi:hypothetical protein
MLEQVTIFFIMLELSRRLFNFLVPFRISLYLCLGCVFLVLGVRLDEGSYDFLDERKNFLWTVVSGLQVLISIVTFTMGVKLIYTDPHWGAECVLKSDGQHQ